jgi:hypothetical protein
MKNRKLNSDGKFKLVSGVTGKWFVWGAGCVGTFEEATIMVVSEAITANYMYVNTTIVEVTINNNERV